MKKQEKPEMNPNKSDLERNMNNQPPTSWDQLRRHCTAILQGPVAEVAATERLLATCWDDLVGDDGGTDGYKLLNRTEDLAWEPPTLSFCIERHGDTVMGSSRAERELK
jgi:hypothetical protein